MCEWKLESDDWMSKIQFLSGQTASEAWSSFHCSFQTARTQSPYCPHFIHENIVFLGYSCCSFQQRWQMQTSARLPNFFWTLDDLLGKTESYLECEMRGELHEEWYGYWCEASVVQWMETLLVKSFVSTYAKLSKQLTHTWIHFWSDTHTHTHTQVSMYGVWVVYMQQVKAHQRRIFCKAQ